jgi:hypothetical protein
VGLVCGSGTEREKAGVATAAGVAGLQGGGRERAGADTGRHWVATRRSLADRLVVAARLLLFGVGVERRGRLVGNVDSFDRGVGLREEAKQQAGARRQAVCDSRGGGLGGVAAGQGRQGGAGSGRPGSRAV